MMKRLTDMINEPRVPVSLLDEDVDKDTKEAAIKFFCEQLPDMRKHNGDPATILSDYLDKNTSLQEDIQTVLKVKEAGTHLHHIEYVIDQFKGLEDVDLPDLDTVLRYSSNIRPWKNDTIKEMVWLLKELNYDLDQDFFTYASHFEGNKIAMAFVEGFDDAKTAFKAVTSYVPQKYIEFQQSALVFLGYTSMERLEQIDELFTDGTYLLEDTFLNYQEIFDQIEIERRESFTEVVKRYAEGGPEKIEDLLNTFHFMRSAGYEHIQFVEHFELMVELAKWNYENSVPMTKSLGYVIETSDYDPKTDAKKILDEAVRIDSRIKNVKGEVKDILEFKGDERWLETFPAGSQDLETARSEFGGDYDRFQKYKGNLTPATAVLGLEYSLDDISAFHGCENDFIVREYIELVHDRLSPEVMRNFIENKVGAKFVDEILKKDVNFGNIFPIETMIGCSRNGFTAQEVIAFNKVCDTNKYLDDDKVFDPVSYLSDMKTFYNK